VVNLLSLSLRNPCRLILAWLRCMGASARESRVSVAIYSFDVAGRPGLHQSGLTSSLLRWSSLPRPTKEWPYDLLGPWAFREVFYSFSGPGGYLSPTGWFFESVVGRILDSGCRLKTVVGFEFYLSGCTSYRCLQHVILASLKLVIWRLILRR
jgi:hypothetical protein